MIIMGSLLDTFEISSVLPTKSARAEEEAQGNRLA